MKIQKYTIKIANNFMEYNHGIVYPITEYFVPKEKFFFNTVGGLNVFRLDSDNIERADNATNFTDIEVPDKLVNSLKNYLLMKEEMELKAKKLSKQISSLCEKESRAGTTVSSPSCASDPKPLKERL